MNLSYQQKKDWIYISAPGRWDAFNFNESKAEIENLANRHRQLAINVAEVQFISIPMIKLIHSIATSVSQKGGRLALVGATERMKRQFHIFASLDPLKLYSLDGWDKLVNVSLEGNA